MSTTVSADELAEHPDWCTRHEDDVHRDDVAQVDVNGFEVAFTMFVAQSDEVSPRTGDRVIGEPHMELEIRNRTQVGSILMALTSDEAQALTAMLAKGIDRVRMHEAYLSEGLR